MCSYQLSITERPDAIADLKSERLQKTNCGKLNSKHNQLKIS
jgi:hypothetical protein